MNPSSRLVSGWYWWRAMSLSIHFIICSWLSGSNAMRCASRRRGPRLVVEGALEDHPPIAAASSAAFVAGEQVALHRRGGGGPPHPGCLGRAPHPRQQIAEKRAASPAMIRSALRIMSVPPAMHQPCAAAIVRLRSRGAWRRSCRTCRSSARPSPCPTPAAAAADDCPRRAPPSSGAGSPRRNARASAAASRLRAGFPVRRVARTWFVAELKGDC